MSIVSGDECTAACGHAGVDRRSDGKLLERRSASSAAPSPCPAASSSISSRVYTNRSSCANTARGNTPARLPADRGCPTLPPPPLLPLGVPDAPAAPAFGLTKGEPLAGVLLPQPGRLLEGGAGLAGPKNRGTAARSKVTSASWPPARTAAAAAACTPAALASQQLRSSSWRSVGQRGRLLSRPASETPQSERCRRWSLGSEQSALSP